MNKEKIFTPLGIFLAGMLGGIVRFQISRWLPSSPDFPWGTLVVNYLGIFCLVYLVKGYLVYKGSSKGTILALGTGFCGGLTTFSSLLLDAVKLLDTGRYPQFSDLFAFEHRWWASICLLPREEEMVVFHLALACGLGALVRYFFSRYNQGSVLPLGNSHSQSSRLFFDWIML